MNKYKVPLQLIPIIHDHCGHPAFLYERRPHHGELACFRHGYNLDGTKLEKMTDLFRCGSCDGTMNDLYGIHPEGGWSKIPMVAGWYVPYIPLLFSKDPPNPVFKSQPTEHCGDSTIPYGEH